MGSSRTKTSSTSNQTQTAAPPTWTLPGLTDVAGMVTNAVGQIPTSHYTGPMVATYDPADIAAIQSAWGNTAANATDLASMMQSTVLPQLSDIGNGLDWTTSLPTPTISAAPVQDAYAAIQASMAPVMHNLTTNILPGITNSALASGAYTSDRALGVMPTEAIRQANETMQNTAATLGYTAYEDWAARDLAAQQAQTQALQANYGLETARQTQQAALQLQALGMTPEMVNSILHTQASAGDLLNMAASLGITADQAGINNAVGMDQYQSQSPFLGLDTASALLAQLSGGWGTTSGHSDSTQTTTQSSPLGMQLLQGALGLGSLAMGIPGVGGALGGALGVAAPAASSLFNVSPTAASQVPLIQP